MKRSLERILTTHTGSLPRPQDLVEPLYAVVENRQEPDARLLDQIRQATADIVKKQAETGIDVVNDGETPKVSYSTYITMRLTGFESHTHVPRRPRIDAADFPDYAQFQAGSSGSFRIQRYACNGPVKYVGQAAVRRDIENFRAALQGVKVEEPFMTAASPGVIALFQPNQYYPSTDEYLAALSDAMKEEYEAIYQAGFLLQVDCPDMTGMSTPSEPGKPPPDLAQRIEALNAATANIPPDRMRMHLCWGNYEGPHHTDTPLRDVLPTVFGARPAGISFEGANPRHAHEWNVFEDVKLPVGKVIIPGVIDSTTNYIEHPELVAQRVERYARLVGRENVMVGSDCGFGTFAGPGQVFPSIVFAKLGSLVEGARMASKKLWGRS